MALKQTLLSWDERSKGPPVFGPCDFAYNRDKFSFGALRGFDQGLLSLEISLLLFCKLIRRNPLPHQNHSEPPWEHRYASRWRRTSLRNWALPRPLELCVLQELPQPHG